VLEFDAKISTVSSTSSLIVQSSDPTYYLALSGSKLYVHSGTAWVDLGAIGSGQWNHYRVVCNANKIEIYMNGVLKYTRPGHLTPGVTSGLAITVMSRSPITLIMSVFEPRYR
jgi:hypothetical protein